MDFKDYYSKQAQEYSRYRPTYPEELFEYLNSIVSCHNLAVDCATGNGQAALGIAKYFNNVIALDASKSQIENSLPKPNITYRVAKVEETSLPDKSVDLVTIATAIHWVNADLFYKEVKRILKSDGVIAVWTYGTTCEIDPAIDKIVNDFSEEVLNEHWDMSIKKVWDFDNLRFPFKKLTAPQFEIKKLLTCEDYLNYIFTWSSTQKYVEVHNSNPLEFLKENLKKIWGDKRRKVIWKINMKSGLSC